MKNITLRFAEKKDIPALAENRLRFLHELQYTFDDEICLRETVHFFEAELDHLIFAYLAEDTNRVLAVGFLLIQQRPFHPHGKNGWTGEILNMYTEPVARGQGLGAQVFDALVAKGKLLGLDKLVLNASEAGYPLYKSRGFTESKPKHMLMELKL